MARPPQMHVQPPAAKKEVPIISGASTVTKRIPAAQDKSVTSMVPASVRVRREAAAVARPVGGRSAAAGVGLGFGLAPSLAAPTAAASVVRQRVPALAAAPDEKYQNFMSDLEGLGAFS